MELEFISAVRANNFELVKKLIDEGVDVNYQDKYGNTALIYASRQGNKEICNLLINYGADINIQNKLGCTALITSSNRGHKEICELLVDAGAGLEVSDKYYKRFYEKGMKEVVGKLAFNRRKHLVDFYYKDW